MKKIILILAILMLMPVKASALVDLTLQDCIAMAQRNNKGIKSYEAKALSREEKVKAVKTEFLPSLELDGEYIFRNEADRYIFEKSVFGPGIPPQDAAFSAKNRKTYLLGLSIEQPLFTGGRLSHSLQKTKKAAEGALFEIDRQKELLTFYVKNTFYTILREQRSCEALERVIETKENRLGVLEERYKEGYIQREDIMQVETDLAFVKLDLRRGKDKKSLALSTLKKFLFYPEDAEIGLKGKLLNGRLIASLRELKEVALEEREDLKASLSAIKVKEEDVKIAGSRFYPQASLQGCYALQKETNITHSPVWVVKAQIEWPLFEWGKTGSEIAGAHAEKQGLINRHEELQREVMIDVEEAWMAVKEKEELIGAHEKKLKTAEYRLNIARERYDEGKIKLIDMIEMETEMIKSYNEYIMAITSLDSELARLEVSVSLFRDNWFIEKKVYELNLKP